MPRRGRNAGFGFQQGDDAQAESAGDVRVEIMIGREVGAGERTHDAPPAGQRTTKFLLVEEFVEPAVVIELDQFADVYVGNSTP